MNFFAHQQQARNKTKVLVVYFAIATIAIAFMVNFAVYISLCFSQILCSSLSDYWQKNWWQAITLVTLAIILLTSVIRWYQLRRQGGSKVILMAGATPLDLNSQNPQHRQLINVVEEMSIASGVPVPRIFIMENELGINAFVAGTEPHNTCLAITRGCLDQLNRDELQGVIGHEYSHILNGDMRINLKLVGILAGITVIGQLGEYLMATRRRSTQGRSFTSSSGKRYGLQVPFIGLALIIVGYVGLFFGRLIKSAISRQREFLADASAVQFTRCKDGITHALHKINQHRFGAELTVRSAEELSHMCFEASHKLSLFRRILATHPPTETRIKKINPYFVPPKLTEKPPADSNIQQRENSNDEMSSAEAFSASILLGQVGNFNASHIKEAQCLLAKTQQSLAAIARGQDPNIPVECMVYGLLVVDNTLPTTQILSLAINWLSAEEIANIKKFINDLEAQNHQQRWILLELAIPRLKQLPSIERQQLIINSKQLVDCDKNVSLEEYLMYAVIKRWLGPQDKHDATFNNYTKLSQEISDFLSVLLSSNSNSLEKNSKQHKELMASFGLEQSFKATSTFNANVFNRSLIKISKLNPFLKRSIIEAAVSCIGSDNRVSKEEFLILRVLCEYLDCPVPVIL